MAQPFATWLQSAKQADNNFILYFHPLGSGVKHKTQVLPKAATALSEAKLHSRR